MSRWNGYTSALVSFQLNFSRETLGKSPEPTLPACLLACLPARLPACLPGAWLLGCWVGGYFRGWLRLLGCFAAWLLGWWLGCLVGGLVVGLVDCLAVWFLCCLVVRLVGAFLGWFVNEGGRRFRAAPINSIPRHTSSTNPYTTEPPCRSTIAWSHAP